MLPNGVAMMPEPMAEFDWGQAPEVHVECVDRVEMNLHVLHGLKKLASLGDEVYPYGASPLL